MDDNLLIGSNSLANLNAFYEIKKHNIDWGLLLDTK